jgi:predicted nucleic acid-binding Zn ribbon protein
MYTTTYCAVKTIFVHCAKTRDRDPTMADGGGMSLLAEALKAALARLPGATGLVHYPLWAEWSAIVGPTIAAHARPARLRRGVLVVMVDGPEWMHELQYVKREVCAKLNARLGGSVVRDVYLVLETG